MLKSQIPLFLQEDLKEILQEEFSKYAFFKIKDKEKNIEIHKQFVPDDCDKKLPYILIKLDSGEDSGEERNTKVNFLFCVYDEDKNYNGYELCVELIERVYQILARKGHIGAFSLKYPIKWELSDDNYYPYFFGGIATEWESARVDIDEDENC